MNPSDFLRWLGLYARIERPVADMSRAPESSDNVMTGPEVWDDLKSLELGVEIPREQLADDATFEPNPDALSKLLAAGVVKKGPDAPPTENVDVSVAALGAQWKSCLERALKDDAMLTEDLLGRTVAVAAKLAKVKLTTKLQYEAYEWLKANWERTEELP